MKICRNYLIVIAILVVSIFGFLVWRLEESEQTSLLSSTQTNIASNINTKKALSTDVNTTNALSLKTNLQFSNPARPSMGTKRNRMVGILSDYNDVPIDFYGKVEDQFGNPVAGASINFSVQVYNGRESTVNRGHVMTDGNGKFIINGYKGESLGFVLVKAGYVLATGDTLFKYSRLEDHPYVSDPGNPTVIKMWKLQGAEPLIGINKTFKIPYTGNPIFFDLLTGGVVSSGGDLEAIVYRTNGIITQKIHGDWSIKLVPINGGIIEPEYNTPHFTYEAPENGYQNSFCVEMNHDNPKWFDNIQKSLFIKSRNGQVYSKLSLFFEINDDRNETMLFQFKGVANTNASRNWEATVPQ